MLYKENIRCKEHYTNTSMIYAETGRFPLASDKCAEYQILVKNFKNGYHFFVKLVYNQILQDPTKQMD